MKKQLLAFVCLLFFISCYENFDNTTESTYIVEEDNLIDTKITGKVIDKNGNIISNYTIIVDDNNFKIESNYFLLQLIQVRKYGQEIKIEKDGKVIAFGNTLLFEENINELEFVTLPSKSILLGEGGKDVVFNLNENIDLLLKSKILINDDGIIQDNNYSLLYNSIQNKSLILSYGRRAFSLTEERLVINILQIIDFDFYTTSGNKLEVAESETLELQINLKELSHINTALFNYDENSQKWKWTAALNPNDNKITVSKSGLYCIAKYNNGIYAEGTIRKSEKPISFQNIIWESTELEAPFVSTNNGNWVTILPAENQQQLSIKDPCNNKSELIVLSTQSTDLFDITLNPPAGSHYNFIGKSFDCNGVINDNPAISIVQSNTQSIYIFDQSQIDRFIPVCDTIVKLAAYDIETNIVGPSFDWEVNQDDVINFIPNCDQLENGYSFIKIKNEYKVFETFNFSFDGAMTSLESQNGEFKFQFSGNDSGKYDEESIHISINDINFGSNGYYISCNNSEFGCGITNCIVSHYEQSNGWIRASFTGTLWMQTINPPIAGNYPIEGVIVCKTN